MHLPKAKMMIPSNGHTKRILFTDSEFRTCLYSYLKVPSESNHTADEISFEWSQYRISSMHSKLRTCL